MLVTCRFCGACGDANAFWCIIESGKERTYECRVTVSEECKLAAKYKINISDLTASTMPSAPSKERKLDILVRPVEEVYDPRASIVSSTMRWWRGGYQRVKVD